MDVFATFRVSLDDLLRKRRPTFKNNLHIKAALDWLCLAQDKTGDSGVSSWYSLAYGWGPSYIETTGYIIDTFLDCACYFKDNDLKERAIKMADFLLKMQLPSGGFRTVTPRVRLNSDPTIFDTGQDILGLTSIYEATKKQKYLDSALKAAEFLCEVQEPGGSWLKYTYGNMVHTYHTRVAWALLKSWKVSKVTKYKKFALRNLEWAAKNQLQNGWFKLNQLPPPNPCDPLTHTISYAIEGFLWSGILLNDNRYIKIAQKSADAIVEYYLEKDFLPATLNNKWQSGDNYACLTGDAQIAQVWLKFYQLTKDDKYLIASVKMNEFLKSTQDIQTKDKNIRGGIKGSLPIYGEIISRNGYQKMAYLNWATKFFIDALLLEIKINGDK